MRPIRNRDGPAMAAMKNYYMSQSDSTFPCTFNTGRAGA